MIYVRPRMPQPRYLRKLLRFVLLLTGISGCGSQRLTPHPAPMVRTTCVDVAVGTPRPQFGCFNVAVARSVRFSQPSVYWHLRTFRDRADAEAARSSLGLVVEEDGRIWLSEFGPPTASDGPGEPVAIVGPLELPRADTFNVVLSFAIMRPGDRSMIHTHPGPEGWYILAGEQCVQTPSGSKYAVAGGTMITAPDIPIELRVTGTSTRRALLVVIHDASRPRTIPSNWKPPADCGA